MAGVKKVLLECNKAWGILIFAFSPYNLIAPINKKLVTNKC